MSTHTQLVLLGAIGGLGVVALIGGFLRPRRPALTQAFDRLSPPDHTTPTAPRDNDDTFKARVGARAYPLLATYDWIKIPTSDLSVLRISIPRFLGDKILSALIGLLLFPALNLFGAALGTSLPWQIPVVASLALATALFLTPDLEVRRKAATARQEFTEHLQAYIELVSLNRTAAVGAVQSLERAAAVGDSWVFRRLNEELQKAQLSGQAPWTALNNLSHELELPPLADLADIMTLSGERGSSVADTLRAQSRSLRHEILTTELGEAAAASERLKIPGAVMAVALVMMLAVPSVLNVMNA